MSPLRRRILECLAEWPLPKREIARRIDGERERVGVEIYNMQKVGLVKVCGTAHEAGFVDGYNSTTKAFGLPDFPLLPGAVDREAATLRGRQPRPSRNRGSGVIAPPPYRTGFRWGLSVGNGR
jgi:hypothetical protein